MKTILHRLFGAGRLPPALADQLHREGLYLLDEGIGGSATYRSFRAPGQYYGWKRQWFTAAIALTEVRLLARRGAQMMIDVPLADARLREMRFSLEKEDVLLIGLDASLFHGDWSGAIEYRFRTEHASNFVAALNKWIA